MRVAIAVLLLASTAAPALAQSKTPAVIADTRAAIAGGDFTRGEQVVAADRTAHGVTPANLEAESWLGRGALAAKQFDKAEGYAERTYAAAAAELKGRAMDQEPRLPVAIGAAIEVLGQVAAARGERTEAVAFLKGELEKYRTTSLYKRIQKNINLIGLDGQRAMPVESAEFLGTKPPSLEALRGKVVLLFFWAHWCADCKAMGPVLERLSAKYASQGLVVMAPTQRYGYVAAGKPAPAADEMQYIAQVRDQAYPWMARVAVPVSERSHRDYGVSTTPTVVLVDREGLIRLYNPGQMKDEALEPLVRKLLETSTAR